MSPAYCGTMATDSDLRLWLEMSLVRVTPLCRIMQDYKKEALLAGCSVCAVYDQWLRGRQAASTVSFVQVEIARV